jgi:hypothetical protein
MKIVKVKDYDNEGGMEPTEIDKLLAEKKLRPLTEAEWMGLPINCVTGRRGELVEQGVVKADGKKYDEKTDRMAMTWRLI